VESRDGVNPVSTGTSFGFGYDESSVADGPGALSALGDTTGVNKYMSEMMGDAPACDQCGHITVRNGSCYKCLNCGNSLGCS